METFVHSIDSPTDRTGNSQEYVKKNFLGISCGNEQPWKEDLVCLVREDIESVGATAIRDNLQEFLPLSKKKLIITVNPTNSDKTPKMIEKLSVQIKKMPDLGLETSLTIM